MAQTFEIQIEGLDTLVDQLQNLEKRAQQSITRKALRAAARPVVNAARAKGSGISRRGGRGIRAVVKREGGEYVAKVGAISKYWWMGLHEIGFRGRAARPFLRPALDEQQGAVVQAFEQTVNEEIALAIARAALAAGGDAEEIVE